MVKLSDIYKKKLEQKDYPPPIKQPETYRITKSEFIPKEEVVPIKKDLELEKLTEEQLKSRSELVYDDLLNIIKQIYNFTSDEVAIPESHISSYFNDFLDIAGNNYDSLFPLLENLSQECYLYTHSLNVAILSTIFGKENGSNKTELEILFISGLLHDIGMMKYFQLVNQPKILTLAEMNEVKKHSYEGSILIKDSFGLNSDIKQIVSEIILQIHERINGTGYPRNLTGNKINKYAKIIGLIDIYEALTHNRSYRKGISPHKAIEYLIKEQGITFEATFVRSLIDIISVYPVGSIVKLSTGDTAIVKKVHRGFPTRPVVEIFKDAGGNPVEGRIFPLVDNPTIYIQSTVE